MPSIEIKNRVLKVQEVYWKEFKFFQTERFKELSALQKARLKESLLRNQFVETFKVWEAEDGSIYCLDGYHRCCVLRELEKGGVAVPKTFLGEFIDCKNKTEAAVLPLIYSSTYATVTEDGFKEYVETNHLNINQTVEFVNIPSIDIHDIIREANIDDRQMVEFFEDEDIEDSAERETVEKNEFALAIVLTRTEHDLWENFKKRIGIKRDVEAFRKVLPFLEKIEKR